MMSVSSVSELIPEELSTLATRFSSFRYCRPFSCRSSGSAVVHPTSLGLTTRKRNKTNPTTPMIRPGMMNDKDQSVSTYSAAISDPKMLPMLVCEFHRPKMRPRFFFPNQLLITVTTPGQPVVWATPARPCTTM
jgi:hypothetical protein